MLDVLDVPAGSIKSTTVQRSLICRRIPLTSLKVARVCYCRPWTPFRQKLNQALSSTSACSIQFGHRVMLAAFLGREKRGVHSSTEWLTDCYLCTSEPPDRFHDVQNTTTTIMARLLKQSLESSLQKLERFAAAWMLLRLRFRWCR